MLSLKLLAILLFNSVKS